MAIEYLYAYPDNEVVDQLLPQAKANYKSRNAALDAIQTNPGLIPIAVDPEAPSKIYWADFGKTPFREWQFMYSVKTLAEKDPTVTAFTTDFAILRDQRLVIDSVYPSGFIFHVSRCGSTLFGKALARADSHLIINQAGPLQHGFWAERTAHWTQALDADDGTKEVFRNLLLCMLTRRLDQYRSSFVKFISWNVLYLSFVREAFPGVPCLFMYRDPVEVIASVRRETTAPLVAKRTALAPFLTGLPSEAIADLDDTTYLAQCFSRYFTAVLDALPNITLLHYSKLNAENFPAILSRAFGHRPEAMELSAMLKQFDFYSKDDSHDARKFSNDSKKKQAMISAPDRRKIENIVSDSYCRLLSAEGIV